MMSERGRETSASLGLASRVSAFSSFSHNLSQGADFSRSFLSGTSGSILRPDDAPVRLLEPPAIKARRVSLPGYDGADDSRFASDVSGDVGATMSQDTHDVSPPAPRHRFTPASRPRPPTTPERSGHFAGEGSSTQSDAGLVRRMTIAGAMPPRPESSALKRHVSETGLAPETALADAELDGLKALLGECEHGARPWREDADAAVAPRSRPRAVTVKRTMSSNKLWQAGPPAGPPSVLPVLSLIHI